MSHPSQPPRPVWVGLGAVVLALLRIALYVLRPPLSPRPAWSWKNPRLR